MARAALGFSARRVGLSLWPIITRFRRMQGRPPRAGGPDSQRQLRPNQCRYAGFTVDEINDVLPRIAAVSETLRFIPQAHPPSTLA